MNEAKEGASPVHILEVTPAGGGGSWNSKEVQQWLPTCLSTPLLSKAAISDPSADHWYLKEKVLFSYPGSHKLCKLHRARSRGWVASTGLRAEIDRN